MSGFSSNADVDWDGFDPEAYVHANYPYILPADDDILRGLAMFYKQQAAASGRRLRRVTEVGVGPNLYPLLAALPVAEKILAIDPGQNNRDYLQRQLVSPADSWGAFWEALVRTGEPYASISNPFARLTDILEIADGSVFALDAHSTDIASMHFVAESITSDLMEFEFACRQFVRSVRPSGAFFAAFMTDSFGYRTGDTNFPAVAVDGQRIANALDLDGVEFQWREVDAEPVRDGHGGMVIAWGRIADA